MRSKASAAPGFLYVPDLGAPGSEVGLSEAESHYVARVCRARVGESIEGSDGRGGVATLRVTSIAHDVRVVVERLERRERNRRAWLLCGPPEGQRADWLVEKLAELGIERWTPVDCERGAWDAPPRAVERWQRLAVAALRQSRSAFRMTIDVPVALRTAVAQVPHGAIRWLAEPDGVGPSAPWGGGLLAAIVGPAGGLTLAEREQLRSEGFAAVSLGPNRLRAETACVCVASVWAAAG